MEIADRLDEELLREHWPLLVGAAIIVVGHLYLYLYRSAEWSPVRTPVLAAIVVVLLIEVGRAGYRRLG